MMTLAAQVLKPLPKAELLWANPREVLNVILAQDCGCYIITATPGIISKVPLLGKACSSTRSKRLRCSTKIPEQPASSSLDASGARSAYFAFTPILRGSF